MKRFLKRINRGVVLGVILMIALIIYIVADTIGFSRSKPELKALVDDFVTAYAASSVTPEAYRSYDEKSISADCLAALKDNASKVINDYMTPEESAMNNMTYYYGMNQFEMLNELAQITEYDYDPTLYGYITECDVRATTTDTLKKSGVNTAQIISSYYYVVDCVGNPWLLAPASTTLINDASFHSVPEPGPDPRTLEMEVTYEFTLKKVNGSWRIAYVDMYGFIARNTGTSGDGMEYIEETDVILMDEEG